MKNPEAFKKGIAMILATGSLVVALSGCAPLQISQWEEYRYQEGVRKDNDPMGRNKQEETVVKYTPFLIADKYNIDINMDTLKCASMVHAFLQIDNCLNNIEQREYDDIPNYNTKSDDNEIDAYEIEQRWNSLQNSIMHTDTMGDCSCISISQKIATECNIKMIFDIINNMKVERKGQTIKMTINPNYIQQLTDLLDQEITINEKGEIEEPEFILKELLSVIKNYIMGPITINYLSEIEQSIEKSGTSEEHEKTTEINKTIKEIATSTYSDGYSSIPLENYSKIYSDAIYWQSNKSPADTHSDIMQYSQFDNVASDSCLPLNEIESKTTFGELAKTTSKFSGTYKPSSKQNTR